MITIIAAIGSNNELGKDNSIIWHLPNDFKHFKEATTGKHIIMGRKTFESFPKLLPNRTHVIITRQKDYKADGCIVVDSLEKAIEECHKEEEIFIIGGGEIYDLALSISDKIVLTKVQGSFDADTFFPSLNMEEWYLESSVFNSSDEKHKYNYIFETFVRCIK